MTHSLTRRTARLRLLGLAAALLVGATTLAACGEQSASTEPAVAEAPAMMAEGEAMMDSGSMMDQGSVMQQAPADREIIRTGYLSMRVENMQTSIGKVRELITASGGIISAEDASGSGGSEGEGITYANITAQIPADGLDAFVKEVSTLGVVDNVSINAQDVTQQGIDLDARIAALETSIERLNELLAQADKVEDLVAIEGQLSARQAELDSLVAQRTWLSQQVAMSTVTISLSPITTIADVEVPGFLSGLESGWSALVTLAKVSVTAAGFLLPFLLIAAVIAIPLTILLVRRARRKRSA